MKKLFFLIFLINFSLYAQEEEYLNSDRPDQSEGVYILPKGKLQLEDGFVFSQGVVANNLMFRYGLAKKLEIRLETDFQLNNSTNFEFNTTTLSSKYNLTQGGGWLPSITAVGYLTYNIMPESSFSPDFALAFEYELSEKLAFDWNVGINSQFQNWLLTAELNYNPIPKLGFFAEYYANFAGSVAPNHNVDMGVMYALSPHFQLDMAGGRTLFSSEVNYFGVIGFSYKLKR